MDKANINPWQTLGVNRQSTPEEVRHAYIELAKVHHPDKPNGSAEKCAELNDAYQVLKDKRRCSAYVDQLLLYGAPCIKCKGNGATYRQKGMTSRVATQCKACNGSGIILREGGYNEFIVP